MKRNNLIVGVSDKILMPWLEGKEYLDCSDEGEAVAIAAGHYLQTKERGTAFMSADGFMNALNFITSWVIPEEIEMNIVISIGRMEKPHYIATEITEPIIKMLEEKYAISKRISFEFVRKQ
jgi:sulfopyruvate decarboxylase TPP-binding subunit